MMGGLKGIDVEKNEGCMRLSGKDMDLDTTVKKRAARFKKEREEEGCMNKGNGMLTDGCSVVMSAGLSQKGLVSSSVWRGYSRIWSWRQIIAGGRAREGKSPKGDVMERCLCIFHVIKLSGVV
jgi:hypothetical protein